MNKKQRIKKVLGFLFILTGFQSVLFAQSGIITSQLGYDTDAPKQAFLRGDKASTFADKAVFQVTDLNNNPIHKAKLKKQGEKWKAHWWVADFSAIKKSGRYLLKVDGSGKQWVSDTIEVADNPLWQKCYPVMAFDFFDTRTEKTRTGKGWRDSGSDLQEFSSHVVAIDGLCDVLEIADISKADKSKILKHIVHGTDFLTYLQDKADSLQLGYGTVIHEDRQTDVVTGNVAKAAMIFARVSRLIKPQTSSKSEDYLERAKRAFQWIEKNGPVINEEEQLFFAPVHGAPKGSLPPQQQWMTRDLLMMVRASVELFKAEEEDYKDKAIHYAQKVMARQVPKSKKEGSYYGHFYTYGTYEQWNGYPFTEKANIHCGAWSHQGRIYNKGGHYPHYLLPFIDMMRLWPKHKDTKHWQKTLKNFAYGYLLPTTSQSPFYILPSGYYKDEGLIFFGSWYHGHNNMYAYTASMALEYEKLFKDTRFRKIAYGNLQWIAGLNYGIKEQETVVGISMISGIGARFRGSWTNIPGSICNGFSSSPQFKIELVSAATDYPKSFDTEDYIAHTLPYLAALARWEHLQHSNIEER
ncbi:cellulase N-terminal Ig-like domain-containing protein [Flagellimonas onchidii]|uniref:cellulase N-terminal Ig-like domain-containing protein n=1 Tax=Flagellimonas onchidii TaxID=2562684 RepID=UPI0010A6B576|nr:cellulase N-terminal Ig-like domain-containing protein [Allomuricauda onchidii]